MHHRRLSRLTGALAGRLAGPLVAAVLALVSAVLSPAPAAAAAGQVYLVQASGWMDGYINNTAGAFQRRIERFVALTRQDAWPMAVASFNSHREAEKRADGCSPRLLYPVDGCVESSMLALWSEDGVRRALAAVTIPQNDTGGLANAFLEEALLRARIIALADQPQGIVWIVTNNKNAPIGTMAARDVFASSAAFMKRLSGGWEELGATGVVALPVEMAAQSASRPHFGRDAGFMIYGIAFGDVGLRLLHHVVERPQLIAEFGRAFRIRPLEREALRLVVEPQQVDEKIEVGLDRDGNVFVGGAEVGRAAPLVLRASLQNTIYPYVVRRAALRLAWQPDESAARAELRASVVPAVVEAIAPGEAREITISLDFSAVRPDDGSKLVSEAFVSSGSLRLEVADIDVEREPDAVQRLRRVFLGDAAALGGPSADDLAVPQIFLAGNRIPRSDGMLPLHFAANAYPKETILQLLAAIVALIAAGLTVAHFARRRPQIVDLDGQRVKLNLRPFERTTYTAASGRTWTVKGGLFGEKSARAAPLT